jgi:hypothetical protein
MQCLKPLRGGLSCTSHRLNKGCDVACALDAAGGVVLVHLDCELPERDHAVLGETQLALDVVAGLLDASSGMLGDKNIARVSFRIVHAGWAMPLRREFLQTNASRAIKRLNSRVATVNSRHSG